MRNNNKNQKQITHAALHSCAIGEKGRTTGATVASKAQVLPGQERVEQ